MAALLNLIFRSPPSIYLMVVSAVHITSYAMTGLKEVKGSHMKYSKFANHSISSANSDKEKEKLAAGMTISSKAGMLLIYTPAFVASAASFAFFFSLFAGLRPVLVTSALSIHFLKRILEVSFLHRYSGGLNLGDSITISLSYFFAAANCVYSQKLVVGEGEPQVDLMSLGVGLFLVGIVGNFYHHLLLSGLRKEDKKKKGEPKNYKVPRGGLFDLVVCPHYLFEIIDWFGIACISQTMYPFCFAIGSTFYLMGRSYATRKWYQSKFEDFPKGIRALVPFVF